MDMPTGFTTQYKIIVHALTVQWQIQTIIAYYDDQFKLPNENTQYTKLRQLDQPGSFALFQYHLKYKL